MLTREALRVRVKEMRVLVATDDSGQVVGTAAYKAENREGRTCPRHGGPATIDLE